MYCSLWILLNILCSSKVRILFFNYFYLIKVWILRACIRNLNLRVQTFLGIQDLKIYILDCVLTILFLLKLRTLDFIWEWKAFRLVILYSWEFVWLDNTNWRITANVIYNRSILGNFIINLSFSCNICFSIFFFTIIFSLELFPWTLQYSWLSGLTSF